MAGSGLLWRRNKFYPHFPPQLDDWKAPDQRPLVFGFSLPWGEWLSVDNGRTQKAASLPLLFSLPLTPRQTYTHPL
jgi:hypothetical protein